MSETKSHYALRLFRSSADPGFSSILSIYAKYTDPSLRTNSNEVTYWLDHYNSTFEDALYIFGFYVDEKPAGYAQLTYFALERFAIIDYLTLHESYRRTNVFFECIEHIKRFIEKEGLEINFVLIEAGCRGDSREPDESSRLMIRLLKLQGFRVIKASYFQPLLHRYNLESEMRAVLLIWSSPPLEYIKRETYIQVVKVLYYNHYLRWHQIYSHEVEEYTRNLDHLTGRIEAEMKESKIVKINGHKNVLTAEPAPALDGKANVLYFSAASLIFVMILTYCMLYLGREFEAPLAALGTIYFIVLASFFGFLSLFWQRAERMFDRVADLLKIFFDRTK